MAEKTDRTGEVGVNNNGEEMRIIRYGNCDDIDVLFVKDGTVIEHKQYSCFKKGRIKNPFFSSVYGVGCIGIGKFKPYENGKPTKCYITWMHMMERCYDPKLQEKEPTYKGCTVCPEWWNFQVFAEWYYSHFYEIENEKMNLDKDILHKGNKVYSPNNCVFVPQFINSLFTKSNNTRGKFPIGVYKMGNKFKAYLSKDNGKQIYLGTYPTPEEAFLAYKQAKEEYIKQIAEKYKAQIPYELYQAMMNYEVEIND